MNVTRINTNIQKHLNYDSKLLLEIPIKPCQGYLVPLMLQICKLAIQYKGKPFNEPIASNKAMLKSLVIVGRIAFAAATEISPELNEWMQSATYPKEFRTKLLITMTAELGLAWIIEYTIGVSLRKAPNASLYPSA
jgi:cation-transporting ATPase 13A1